MIASVQRRKASPGAGASADAMLEAVLGSWNVGFSTNANESLDGLQEHVPGKEASAVLLARVMIPVTLDRASPATVGPTLEPTQAVAVDQSLRPIIYFPGKWRGLATT